ncbi:MAG: hypothetical protein C4303_06080 [candidate division GAL15 bacterium]
MVRACIAGFLLAAAVPAAAGVAVDRRLIVVAFNVAGHVQDGPQAGYYYVAFGGGAGTLRGPEPQGEGWVAYVLFHRGRFYLGRGPAAIPPSVFRFTRPPEPYSRGLVTQDRRGVVVELPILELAAGGVPVRTVKVNVVTLDGDRRLLDALGKGSDDRLGFVTLDLARELYQPFTDPQGDAPEDYDIVSGSVSVKVP